MGDKYRETDAGESSEMSRKARSGCEGERKRLNRQTGNHRCIERERERRKKIRGNTEREGEGDRERERERERGDRERKIETG